MKNLFLVILTIFSVVVSWAQSTALENDQVKLTLSEKGNIKSLLFKDTQVNVTFSNGQFAGPSWYLTLDGETFSPQKTTLLDDIYKDQFAHLSFTKSYELEGSTVIASFTVTNEGHSPLQPDKIGVRLGVDTYMADYPDWNDKYFPTLMRAEKTHFWGYFQSPLGKILEVATEDPIASWSHEYSKSWGDEPYLYEGHRITSVNLDFINKLPLPERHPQHLWQLLPGETKEFTVKFASVGSLDDLYGSVADLTGAATIVTQRTAGSPGEKINFEIVSIEDALVQLIRPSGQNEILAEGPSFSFTLDDPGYYKVLATTDGRVSEAQFYCRKPYSWYMDKAMNAVNIYPQKASKTHCEGWYGFYTTYAGGTVFGEIPSVKEADKQFGKILPIVFDTVNHALVERVDRIQNVSSIIGILVDKYEMKGNKSDLDMAIEFSDYLIAAQTPDGVYRATDVHYTSVIYIAKSMMELMDVIEPLKADKIYNTHYNRIYDSVRKAIDELALNRANIETEGEMTFEDGMISCSSLQLSLFALHQKSEKLKNKYKEAALDLLTQHECLEQLAIPDARMRSGSLRFWEAQYDVIIGNNFFNSPHGWSAWLTYANYYAYLLTGDIKYLNRTFNGLDAGMQLVDLETGTLRWAFMVNPHIEAKQIRTDLDGATPLNFPGMHYQTDYYPTSKFVAGEQYVDMVSDWFFSNSCDNDVHEYFKCLGEVALSNAFVYEENGQLKGINCTVSRKGKKLTITPDEEFIDQVHVNIKGDFEVKVAFSKALVKSNVKEMTWIKK